MTAFLIGILCNLVADTVWVVIVWFMHTRQIKRIEDLFNPDTPGGMSDAVERISNGKTSPQD